MSDLDQPTLYEITRGWSTASSNETSSTYHVECVPPVAPLEFDDMVKEVRTCVTRMLFNHAHARANAPSQPASAMHLSVKIAGTGELLLTISVKGGAANW